MLFYYIINSFRASIALKYCDFIDIAHSYCFKIIDHCHFQVTFIDHFSSFNQCCDLKSIENWNSTQYDISRIALVRRQIADSSRYSIVNICLFFSSFHFSSFFHWQYCFKAIQKYFRHQTLEILNVDMIYSLKISRVYLCLFTFHECHWLTW